MKFDNLDDLQVLVATADTGSLTAAGKRCGIGTAAVSAAIKRLEASLAVRLLERTTRMVRLTAEGALMVDHARRGLDILAQGAAQLNPRGSTLEGKVRMTASTALTRELVAPWIADFAARHPKLEIEIQVTDVVLDLMRDALDIALRHGPLPPSNVARLLAPARRVACASPAYIARHGLPLHPRELARHECLVYFARGRLLSTWEFEPLSGARDELIKAEVKGRLVSSDASIAHQWALEGRGVIYESELGILAALSSGALVRLFPEYTGSHAPLYAVLPSNRFIAPRVQVLVDELALMLGRTLDQVRLRS